MQSTMGRMARIGSVVAAAAMLLAFVLVLPAQAQDPYPPPPPPGPPPQADVDCDPAPQGRAVACDGENFQPGSTVTLQLHRVGGPQAASGSAGLPLATITGLSFHAQSNRNVVASGHSVVLADGTFTVQATVPCEYDNDRVRAQVRGTDARGNARTFTEVVDIDPCALPRTDNGGALTAGDTQGLPRTDDGGALAAGDIAGLALTGVQVLLLVAVSLMLLAVGTLLVRHRRGRQATNG